MTSLRSAIPLQHFVWSRDSDFRRFHLQSSRSRRDSAHAPEPASLFGAVQRPIGGSRMTTLNDVLETTEMEKIAGGFLFTEGPLWHPDGFVYFVDLKSNLLYRMVIGEKPVKIRDTDEGNGCTFDLQGRLINCEGGMRRVYRIEHDGSVTTIADTFEGKRLSRPNDAICARDGTIYFTDPNYRVPLAEREIGHGAIYRIGTDGSINETAKIEYPNGLALSKDERTLFVANTRWNQYITAM